MICNEISELQCKQDYPKMGIPSKIKVFNASCPYKFHKPVFHKYFSVGSIQCTIDVNKFGEVYFMSGKVLNI
jgi:hypothetical protein